MLAGLLRGVIIAIIGVNSVFAETLLLNQQAVLCVGENSSISQLQGQGKRSPVVKSTNRSDKIFTVQGQVTRLKRGHEPGFFMQQIATPELMLDNIPERVSTSTAESMPASIQQSALASTGIFVSTEILADITLNSRVCVTGVVEEHYGLTRLRPTSHTKTMQTGSVKTVASNITPTDIIAATADAHFSDTLERYEGMKVRVAGITDMRVTKPLYYERRWRRYNIILSHQQINIHPNTTAFPASIAADALALNNKQRRLYVQLGSGLSVPSNLDYMRVNDRVTGIVGVLTFSYGEFRLLVDNGLAQARFLHHIDGHSDRYRHDKHLHNSDRQQLAVRDNNDLRIASFNLLNYFNRAAGGVSNPLRQNRGAKTLSALHKQERQLRDTLLALDADFIGLMEVENNGFGQNSAIVRLLGLVNQEITDPSQHYALVKPDKADLHQGYYLGTGAISVAGFYRPTKLKLVNTRVIQLPVQRRKLGNKLSKAYHRPALTPTFIRMDSADKNNKLTISVNHFKSKGSKCVEDKRRATLLKKLKNQRKNSPELLRAWQKAKRTLAQDRQGHCAQFRTTAASILGQALATVPGSKIILGDLNSYPKEDPLLVLTDYEPARYSYYKITHSEHNYVGKTLLSQHTDTGFGYYDPFDNQPDVNWTYSFKALGRLDYILLSPDLVSNLVKHKVWHINAAESDLVNHAKSLKSKRELAKNDVNVGDKSHVSVVYSSSDHEPLFIDLK
ncbi:ExeM/NucH family extracellular endonuclease [Moritella marina ATCC 15381]|uniref:ExeM/NucH family extracellular endonuclease n=1 Tax=Moritella marina ATCC 15381 TaxID=1202962 RepID=A0A5J6WL51_MORMI|nr:ExeM/NucH family extracellular endonuclease [Moritella marina]QFI37810.1 ExeM/NucH family extracellular endonuclease [Moritella marina ATCC 15381]